MILTRGSGDNPPSYPSSVTQSLKAWTKEKMQNIYSRNDIDYFHLTLYQWYNNFDDDVIMILTTDYTKTDTSEASAVVI